LHLLPAAAVEVAVAILARPRVVRPLGPMARPHLVKMPGKTELTKPQTEVVGVVEVVGLAAAKVAHVLVETKEALLDHLGCLQVQARKILLDKILVDVTIPTGAAQE
jgi:hypothetical protein